VYLNIKENVIRLIMPAFSSFTKVRLFHELGEFSSWILNATTRTVVGHASRVDVTDALIERLDVLILRLLTPEVIRVFPGLHWRQT